VNWPYDERWWWQENKKGLSVSGTENPKLCLQQVVLLWPQPPHISLPNAPKEKHPQRSDSRDNIQLNTTDRRPGFRLSPAGDDKVICDICARVCPPGKPILKKSIHIHLEAREHKRCVISEQQQAQERSLAESAQLDRQQQRDRLRPISLPQTNLHLTRPELSQSAQANAHLETFWDEYDADPSSFHVDTDPDPVDTSIRERERIEKALNEFGDWDDVAMGYALGANQEDDVDLLAENQARDDEQQVEDMLDALCEFIWTDLPPAASDAVRLH